MWFWGLPVSHCSRCTYYQVVSTTADSRSIQVGMKCWPQRSSSLDVLTTDLLAFYAWMINVKTKPNWKLKRQRLLGTSPLLSLMFLNAHQFVQHFFFRVVVNYSIHTTNACRDPHCQNSKKRYPALLPPSLAESCLFVQTILKYGAHQTFCGFLVLPQRPPDFDLRCTCELLFTVFNPNGSACNSYVHKIRMGSKFTAWFLGWEGPPV